MNTENNLVVESKAGRKLLLDIYFPKLTKTPKSIVLFAHGFKGFKDWGCWDLIGKVFVDAGFLFIKFNFSHNGTTVEQPLDFADLEAFGANNYTNELLDIETVLDWIPKNLDAKYGNVNHNDISLIGHSRGGGVSMIAAHHDDRIKRVIGWASVASLSYFWENNDALVEKWKTKGVAIIRNGRTKQDMPLYYQLKKDFDRHKKKYSVKNTLENFKKPLMIIHGGNDKAVPEFAAHQMKEWYPKAELYIIENANHVFGGKHPWTEKELPDDALDLVEATIDFIQKQ